MSPELSVSRDERLKRLRERLQSGAPAAAFEGRTEVSRGARLLYGVMLHGAARLQSGLEPTDLEARLIRPVAQLLSEEEVCDFGRVYQEEAATRSRLLPDTLAARPVSEGYSIEDLIRDLPAVREEIAAQANVNMVDLDSLPPVGEDSAPAAPDSEEFQQGMAAYGYGATLVTAAGHQSVAQDKPPLQVDMTLPRFYCRTESHELSGSNEIYWALAAGADEGVKQESITRTYGDVDHGETHNMDANTVLFRGQVSKVLLVHIECWEADEKVDPALARTIREIATGLQDTAEIMGVLPGGTAWELVADFIAMLGTIGHLIGEIIGWLADDLLSHRTIAFDRAAMNALADPIWPNPDTTWWFIGPTAKEGEFSLDIRGRYYQPSSNNVTLLTHSAGWGAPSIPWPGAKTPDAPALAMHNGNLYCAVRGMGNQVFVSRRETDGRWSGFGQVPGVSTLYPPALASFNGQLYLAVKRSAGDTTNNRAWVLSSVRGDSWTALTSFIGWCQTGPALAVHNNRLWLATFHGKNYRSLMVGSMGTGGSWQTAAEWPAHQSTSAPALAVFNGKLHLAYRNTDDKICVTARDDRFNADNRWPAPTLLSGSTPNAPALSVRGTALHCAVRGGDDHIHLCHTTDNGWNTFVRVTAAGKSLSNPAMATSGNDLNIVYRALL
ncbi:hypothetical protein C9F11_44470 (plasmid) [Streptomyces sp. YIM 121038]|uniref:hypothetical protein n=1 Tax=Streptomyces sp. YIM 121038 TaxID=2136401 RepID=UPI00111026D9|nr:hypothetical protein [Streptomyces sp. YIM 121038]QCX82247.1 hypothetical protein C9F11_43335 [Streptomyces sp. YIM 121038]QCX82387.1 hypothetical protein C9F11_44045 [Streptomyces sp. YIM 121038]QCX82462.1 hypothetical protein C9F11_44470 [Streptomyces sp. YIM 121038]